MTPQQRVEGAQELGRQAFVRLRDWEEEPDPVGQRKLRAEAVTLLRSAADLLESGQEEQYT